MVQPVRMSGCESPDLAICQLVSAAEKVANHRLGTRKARSSPPPDKCSTAAPSIVGFSQLSHVSGPATGNYSRVLAVGGKTV